MTKNQKSVLKEALLITLAFIVGIVGAAVLIYVILGDRGQNNGILFVRERSCEKAPNVEFVVLDSDNAYAFNCSTTNDDIFWNLTDGTNMQGKAGMSNMSSSEIELRFYFDKISTNNVVSLMDTCYLSFWGEEQQLPVHSPYMFQNDKTHDRVFVTCSDGSGASIRVVYHLSETFKVRY